MENYRTVACLHCGYSWRPRQQSQPVQCPACKSASWNRPIGAVYIYGLVDPDNQRIVYVGSTKSPEKRAFLQRYISSQAVKDYVRNLHTRGLTANLIILEQTIREAAHERENAWIEKLQNEGAPLLNTRVATKRCGNSSTIKRLSFRDYDDGRLIHAMRIAAAQQDMSINEWLRRLIEHATAASAAGNSNANEP